MRADTYYMLSFESTHEAIAAQRRFKDRVPVCVMPTLRAVQAGCGISLRVEAQDAKKLKAAIPNGLEAGWRLFWVQGGAPVKIEAEDLYNLI